MTPAELLAIAIRDQCADDEEARSLAARTIHAAADGARAGEDAAIRYVCSEWLDAWCAVLGDGVRADVIRREILGLCLAESGMPSREQVMSDAAQLVELYRAEHESVAGVARRLGCSRRAARLRLVRAGVVIHERGRPRAQEAA